MKLLNFLLATSLTCSFSLFADNLEPLAVEQIEEESDSTLATLEEELRVLDQEFKEFNEELFSLEPAVEENLISISEENNALEDKALEAMAEPGEISSIIDTPLISFNEEPSVQEIEMQEPPALLQVEESLVAAPEAAVSLDLKQAFSGAPFIYSLLLAMSVGAVTIWLYSLFLLSRAAKAPRTFTQRLQNTLNSNHFEEAMLLCEQSKNLLSKMVASGIQTRRHGLPIMIEAMKAEGKRASVNFWQKVGMLNDIAIIAPMLGLLGTVLGMFYAFYNVNRSIESVSTLFDGLGVSVGTTVAGLVVAILALILHSIAKFRLVRTLAVVENEAQSLANLIDDRTSLYNKGEGR